jgi:succinoglycan biosynthesis protein ExoA
MPMIDPLVSIILPIRNESKFIEHCLHSILAQDYPAGRMEILIADGMSSDDTRQIVRDFILSQSRLKSGMIDNPGGIVSIGMNIALHRVKGEIIIRIDGHTTVAPDYVRRCVESLQQTHADNVGGKMNPIGSKSFGKAVAMATSSSFGIGGGRFHYSDKEEWVETVYLGAWPRRVFEKIGMFDEDLVRDQDDEFNYRLREAGGRILLSPKIKSEYAVRSSSQALGLQYFQYGFWKVRVLQKHPRQMSLRQFVPPVFVTSLFFSALLALFCLFGKQPPVLGLFASITPVLYLLANLAASTITTAKKGWKYLLLLPFVFAILHTSYGLGFLAGLVKFWNRWNDKIGKVPYFSNEPGK